MNSAPVRRTLSPPEYLFRSNLNSIFHSLILQTKLIPFSYGCTSVSKYKVSKVWEGFQIVTCHSHKREVCLWEWELAGVQEIDLQVAVLL